MMTDQQTFNIDDFRQKFPDLFNASQKRFEQRELEKEKDEQWRKQRRGRFTASEIHKLFTSKLTPSNAKTAQSYIMEVAAELFGAHKERVYSAAMNWGNDHEPLAVKEYMKRFRKKIVEHGINQRFHPWGERCGGTPDGLMGKTMTAQFKCPYNPGNHVKNLRLVSQLDLREMSPQYYIQIQCELLFTGRKKCEYISYDPRFEHKWQFKRLSIQPDKEFQPVLIQTLQRVEKEAERIVLDICGVA